MRKIYIAKADQYLEIDEITLPANSLAYFLDYGITQSLSDAAASVKSEDPECAAKTMALVNKRLTKILAGNPPAIGEKTTDPVKARAINIAMERVVKVQWKKAGKTWDAKAGRMEAIAIVKRNSAYIDIAAKQLEREAAEIAELQAAEAAAIGEAMEELEPAPTETTESEPAIA